MLDSSDSAVFDRPRYVVAPDGIQVAVYVLNGDEDDKPALLWGHANGVAAECYGPFLDLLTARFQVFAYDARGHGRSAAAPEPLAEGLSMERLTGELGAVAATVRHRIGGRRFVLATHSLLGVPALRAPWQVGGPAWDLLVAFDPPVFPGPGHVLHEGAIACNAAYSEGARRRRSVWASPAEFHAKLASREPFASWDPAMLAAYVQGSLRPEGEGRWVLRCAGEVEAVIYETVRNASTFANLHRYPGPIRLLAADPESKTAGWTTNIGEAMAACVPGLRRTVMTGVGHMMMFENPRICADYFFGPNASVS